MRRWPTRRALPRLALAALALAAPAAAGAASDLGLRVSAPAALQAGFTSYRIRAADASGQVESLLRFPLDATLAGLRLELTDRRDGGPGTWCLWAGWRTAVASGRGPLQDSDWMSDSLDRSTVGVAHPGKDLYSESRTRLRASAVELGLGRALLAGPRITVTPLVGFGWEWLAFDASDARQVGYGPYAASYSLTANGPVLTYRVEHWTLTAGVAVSGRAGPVELMGRLAAGPALGLDRDDHLLRSKLATSTAVGVAGEAAASARLGLGDHAFLELSGSALGLEARGNQHQRFYAGAYAGQSLDVPVTLRTVRAEASVAVGLRR